MDSERKAQQQKTPCLLARNCNVNNYPIVKYEGELWKAAKLIIYILRPWEFNNDLWVLHHCDTPACINPDHIYMGDGRQNHKDMVDHGAFSPYGHRGTIAKVAQEKTKEMIWKEFKESHAWWLNPHKREKLLILGYLKLRKGGKPEWIPMDLNKDKKYFRLM